VIQDVESIFGEDEIKVSVIGNGTSGVIVSESFDFFLVFVFLIKVESSGFIGEFKFVGGNVGKELKPSTFQESTVIGIFGLSFRF